MGVSFVSAEQACSNLQSEIGPTATFEAIRERSVSLWNEKLSKVQVDLQNTDANVTEMLYSSVYRSFLTPNNATGEGQGSFAGTSSPYFDSLYCSWDTVRSTYHWDMLAYGRVLNVSFIGLVSFARSILGWPFILLRIMPK